jgi:hypothetical protein
MSGGVKASFCLNANPIQSLYCMAKVRILNTTHTATEERWRRASLPAVAAAAGVGAVVAAAAVACRRNWRWWSWWWWSGGKAGCCCGGATVVTIPLPSRWVVGCRTGGRVRCRAVAVQRSRCGNDQGLLPRHDGGRCSGVMAATAAVLVVEVVVVGVSRPASSTRCLLLAAGTQSVLDNASCTHTAAPPPLACVFVSTGPGGGAGLCRRVLQRRSACELPNVGGMGGQFVTS